MTNRLLLGLTLNLLGVALVAAGLAANDTPAVVIGGFLFGWGVSTYVPRVKR